MKIEMEYENKVKEFYFDKSISFHGNINNQNKLYEILLDGLSGSDKTFLLDNQPVKKKELNVIEFSMNSVFDDLKMTSKSYNLKIIQSIIEDEDEDLLLELNELLMVYQTKLRENYRSLTDECNTIANPTINITNVKKVIIDNFSLFSKDDINLSQEIEFQLFVILNYIHMKSDQHFYLMIKHFDHCLDISQMCKLLSKIELMENVSVIIFSKSFELFEYQNKINACNCMVGINEISSLDLSINNDSICYNELLTEVEIKELNYSINIAKRYKKYIEIVSENKKIVNEIFDFE